ncbi:MAG: (Fe-S)-binding protein [Chloroflexi bacterium]|nr:(Fe-S)-binding protein [Chloroflexota bacterium]
MIGDLDYYKGLVEKCSHCALCEAVCPVYLEDMLETHVARARVDIIYQTLYKKSMPVTPRVREIIDRCLLCTSCTQDCGGAVPVHEIIITARAALYGGRKHDPLRDYFIREMMEKRGIKGFPALMLAAAQKLHVAPGGFPKVSLRTFDSLYHGRYPPTGKKRAKVAYFTGCATNTMDVETGVAVMKVLGHNGIEVVIPDKLMCCGIRALGEGDIKTAQKIVRNNIAILAEQEVDAIIVDCTSCGMMLRSETAKLLPADDPLLAKAVALSPKVFEVSDYLNTIGLAVEPGPLAESFTYHVPCHRGWTPTLNDAPLQLLAGIPGLKYSAMEEPEKCCGAGGAFFMDYSGLSRGIRKRKLDDITGTGAAVLISQCPGCRSYLSAGLGKRWKTVHPVTLLRRAYGL